MAIDYTKKNWKNYPDTSTPIMATDLNRMEQGIYDACNGVNSAPTTLEVKSTVRNAVFYSMEGLYPEYTHSTFNESVKTQEDLTMTVVVGLDVFNPDEDDGLIIEILNNILSPDTYTVNVENNAAYIRISSSAGLSLGMTLTFHIFKKPKNITSNTITTIWSGTQAQYDALSTYSATTMYVITG